MNPNLLQYKFIFNTLIPTTKKNNPIIWFCIFPVVTLSKDIKINYNWRSNLQKGANFMKK